MYSRHFLLLTAFAVLMVCLTRSTAAPGHYGAFALYGALHATSLVLAQPAPRLNVRACLFIAVAAGLSVLTLAAGMRTGVLVAGLPQPFGRYLLLAISAAVGAMIYGLAIRWWGTVPLTARTVGKLAIGCMLAAAAGLATLKAAAFAPSWWLAVLWWYAFSLGLWRFR